MKDILDIFKPLEKMIDKFYNKGWLFYVFIELIVVGLWLLLK